MDLLDVDPELARGALLSREAHWLRERANRLREEYDQTLRNAYRQALQTRRLRESLKSAWRTPELSPTRVLRRAHNV